MLGPIPRRNRIQLSRSIPAFIFLTVAASQCGALSLRGAARGEYWLYRDEYRENFETKLEVHATHEGFFGTLGYFIWEPSESEVSIKYPIISLGYSESPVDLVVGHYYATFGRGLVLREYLDRDFKHDKHLVGLKVGADLRPLEITLLSGRPKNLLFAGEAYEILNDTTDLLRGADLTVSPWRGLEAGGSYVRLSTRSDLAPCAFTEVIGGNLSGSIWDWDSYVEYAQQLRCSPARGRVKGEGLYASLSGSIGRCGMMAQYADYRDLGLGRESYRYNDPPTPLRSGLSINRGLDERGGSVMISASLLPSLYAQMEYGYLATRDESQRAAELFLEFKYDPSADVSLTLGAERRDEKEIEPGVTKVETRPVAAVLYYLANGDALELESSYGLVEEEHRFLGADEGEEVDYSETVAVISYNHVPFAVSVRAEYRSRPIERLSSKTFWLFAELATDIRPNINLRLLAGSVRGGLVCSGGVCRIEPDFEGVKAVLSYLF